MDQGAALLELQETDLELLRSERALDELPEKQAILDIRAKQREVTELASKADLLISKLEAEVGRSQDETASVAEKIETEQGKLMKGTVTDHKQVQHISREIDALRRRKDKLELDTLRLMERLDSARTKRETVDSALEQLTGREAQLVERFREQGGGLQTAIAQGRSKREQLVSALDPELLARYESLREAKAGIGVGRLDADSCSACRMQLPAESVASLISGPEVGICPQCRRLIVVRLPGDE